MLKNMHGAFVFTSCLASQSPAFWHCALGWRISLSGPEVPATHKGKIPDILAKSGPFMDHFWSFSGLLVITCGKKWQNRAFSPYLGFNCQKINYWTWGLIWQCNWYRISLSGPEVPATYKGKILEFLAKSGISPDHFINIRMSQRAIGKIQTRAKIWIFSGPFWHLHLEFWTLAAPLFMSLHQF